MLSKEEIENTKVGLRKQLCNTKVANECGLSTNDFSEDIEILENALKYINQLEAREQNLIKQIENAIDFAKTSNDYIDNTVKVECLENVLKILKGEKEQWELK